MSNWKQNRTNFTEDLAVNFLNSHGVQAQRNNTSDITEVDLVTPNKKIDVQFTQNFAKYNSFIMDFASAFFYKKAEKQHSEPMLNEFQDKHQAWIKKPGKYFLDDYLDSVVIFFYNTTIKLSNPPTKDCLPQHVLIITKDDLMEYFYKFVTVHDVRINNKFDLNDKWESAFVNINIKHLDKNTNCLFGKLEDMMKNENVYNYIEG